MFAAANHRAVANFLRGVGATDVRLDHGSKHPRVVFRWNGVERYKSLSGTPGDVHAVDAAIRDIKRTLGLVKSERMVGHRRRHKAHTQKPAAQCPTLSTLHDFRDDLLFKRYQGLTQQQLAVALYDACRGLLQDMLRRTP